MGRTLRSLAVICASAVLLLACAPWLDEFLTAATDQARPEEVRQRLGKPATVHVSEDGGETWSYQMFYASYAGGSGRTNCLEYRLHFDKQKVLKKWEKEQCKQ